MSLLKVLAFPLIMSLIMGITYATVEREKLMDKLIREKNSFSVAIQALQEGKVIHRSGEIKKYLLREIKYPDRVVKQYGNSIGGRDFTDRAYFEIEDVLANDWIIEGK